MKLAIISHPDCIRHQMTVGHPESPQRILTIQNILQNFSYKNDLDYISAEKINKNDLYLAHDKEYVDFIFNRSPKEGLIALDADTYMNPFTLDAALRAAGSAIQGVELVMQEKFQRVFCNIRPPGHHATKNTAMGFCFFNNVAIAARYALKQYQLKRVAIVDFDVHQGNGTLDILKEDSNVLYISSYQDPFYPFVETPHLENLIGIPLNAYTRREDVREKYTSIVFPKLKSFMPELIFFSAGFDAYYLDPLADQSLVEEDYYWLTYEIVKIANQTSQGRIVSLLEGGYKIPELGACVVAHCMALLEKNF